MVHVGRLTATQIKNARAERSRDRWLSDGGGLFLHVRPTGSRAWRLRYTVDGKRRILDLGDATLKSLADARIEANDLREIIDAGLDPIEEARKHKAAQQAEELRQQAEIASRRTFSKAVHAWVGHQLANRKDKGAEALRALSYDFLGPLGERDLKSVSKGDLVVILDKIVARGARRQANKDLRELKQFYHWCEVREWVDRSPLFGVEKKHVGGEETVRDRVLSLGEIAELRDAIPNARLENHAGLAIWILLATLARVGELSAAAWSDVDLEAGTWFIPETKNSRPHTIYLSSFAIAQFRQLRVVTGWSKWVMPSVRKRRPGKEAPKPAVDLPMGSNVLTKQVHDRQTPSDAKKRSKANSGLVLSGGRWTPHDLRRTGATIMGENGVLPEVIERCLNHKEPSKLIRTYQRQERLAERRAAWSVLGDVLDKIVNGVPRKVVPIAAAA